MVERNNCFYTVRRRVLDEQQFSNDGYLIKSAAIEQNTDFEEFVNEARRFIKNLYDDKVDPPEHLYLYCTGVAYGVLALTRAWWIWHIRTNNSKLGMSTMHFNQQTSTWTELVFFNGC